MYTIISDRANIFLRNFSQYEKERYFDLVEKKFEGKLYLVYMVCFTLRTAGVTLTYSH